MKQWVDADPLTVVAENKYLPEVLYSLLVILTSEADSANLSGKLVNFFFVLLGVFWLVWCFGFVWFFLVTFWVSCFFISCYMFWRAGCLVHGGVKGNWRACTCCGNIFMTYFITVKHLPTRVYHAVCIKGCLDTKRTTAYLIHRLYFLLIWHIWRTLSEQIIIWDKRTGEHVLQKILFSLWKILPF